MCAEDEGQRRWHGPKKTILGVMGFQQILKVIAKMCPTERSARCNWLQMGSGQEQKEKQLLNGLLGPFGVLMLSS